MLMVVSCLRTVEMEMQLFQQSALLGRGGPVLEQLPVQRSCVTVAAPRDAHPTVGKCAVVAEV